MEVIRQRAKESLPSVLITLLSIIQALSLEVLWSSVQESSHLFEGGLLAWIGWLQAASALLGIIIIWLMYTTFTMRFRWVPRFRDSLMPFALGIGQFTLGEMLEPGSVPLWFLVLAGVYGFAVVTSRSIFRSAQRDEDNRGFFEMVDPDNLANRWLPVVAVSALIVFSALARWGGPGSALTLACTAVTALVMLTQLIQIGYYWQGSVSGEWPAASDEPERPTSE